MQEPQSCPALCPFLFSLANIRVRICYPCWRSDSSVALQLIKTEQAGSMDWQSKRGDAYGLGARLGLLSKEVYMKVPSASP